jgi:protein involved in polysaccharide export with SLBB domain
MRVARILVPMLVALAAAACARHQQTAYVTDPQTGQPVPVAQRYGEAPETAPPQYAQSGSRRGMFASPQAAQQAYEPPQYAQQNYQQSDAPPQYAPDAPSGGRGLFNSRRAQAQAQAAQPVPQPSYVLQYHPPQAVGGPYAAAPSSYAYAPPAQQQAYTLDSGDKLRVVVFGQEGISGTYLVDAGGNISLPLAGTVRARGVTAEHLARSIGARLKQGYVREPHVTVTIDAYRPFFILGEVTTPGQYPYVPNMTAENAVAVAGGFSPRAKKGTVELTRNAADQQFKGDVPLNYPLRPGDSVVVKERWF